MDKPTQTKKPNRVLTVDMKTVGAYKAARRFAKSQGKSAAAWVRDLVNAAIADGAKADK